MFENLFRTPKNKAKIDGEIAETQERLEQLREETAPHEMHEDTSWKERVLKHKLAKGISDKDNLEASLEKGD